MKDDVTDKLIQGISWTGGAIGNAKWGGAYLRDVLGSLNKDILEKAQDYHLIMQGLDKD